MSVISDLIYIFAKIYKFPKVTGLEFLKGELALGPVRQSGSDYCLRKYFHLKIGQIMYKFVNALNL